MTPLPTTVGDAELARSIKDVTDQSEAAQIVARWRVELTVSLGHEIHTLRVSLAEAESKRSKVCIALAEHEKALARVVALTKAA